MINTYKGNLRLVKVTKLEFEEGILKRFEYVRPVIKEDILFYEGVRKKPISFDYETLIPEEAEAVDIIKQDLRTRIDIEKQPYPTCAFVDYDEITPYLKLTRRQFRELKRKYKKDKKEESKKRSR